MANELFTQEIKEFISEHYTKLMKPEILEMNMKALPSGSAFSLGMMFTLSLKYYIIKSDF